MKGRKDTVEFFIANHWSTHYIVLEIGKNWHIFCQHIWADIRQLDPSSYGWLASDTVSDSVNADFKYIDFNLLLFWVLKMRVEKIWECATGFSVFSIIQGKTKGKPFQALIEVWTKP